jgi:hypothetical protein
MKKYLFILFVLTNFLAFSQFGGIRNRNQGQPQIPQQQQTPKPNFDVEKYIGIVIYDDIERVAKKTGIKLSSDKGKQFSKLLTIYNRKIKDIRRINSFTMKSTKQMVESFQTNAIKTGDLSNQVEIQKNIVENLKPIADTIRNEDVKLLKDLDNVLLEKQKKKFIKYNRKKGKVYPKDIE